MYERTYYRSHIVSNNLYVNSQPTRLPESCEREADARAGRGSALRMRPALNHPNKSTGNTPMFPAEILFTHNFGNNYLLRI
ncbi:unnamed protein product [Arctia plantaginis]|uniref:Uncharacterized protein n=1 Tax=Arctia plantaginis TaxID=874455 RepID=A0A8S0ZPF3_ARCPL|nr:unnamed protein product [Arctia plantaginis]